jgi:DNA-binding beta-propeller fold protein YncE
MNTTVNAVLRVLSVAAIMCGAQAQAGEGTPQKYPTFKVDPYWAKELPNNMVYANVTNVFVDNTDHVWVLTRQKLLAASRHRMTDSTDPASCCRPAPAIMEFDNDGNYIQGWGGPLTPTDPGAKYEWPQEEHGIHVDSKGHVWMCGSYEDTKGGRDDNQCLKFTRDGKFLMQIGHPGKSMGSLNTENFNRASTPVVWEKTNELVVADGYGNRRIVVFDNNTGKFKRMWTAYGNKPDDGAPRTRTFSGPVSQQFNGVHCVAIAKDGMVYVCDRGNNRVQAFTLAGKFVKEGFVARETTIGNGTALGIAFSADKDQSFLYVADMNNYKVHVFDRKTLTEIHAAGFGHAGSAVGQFHALHGLATDSKGNIFTAEASGARVQKFVFTGMSP